jgi:sugar lactone lactonase YvrE
MVFRQGFPRIGSITVIAILFAAGGLVAGDEVLRKGAGDAAPDPRFTATHEQVGTIAIPLGEQKAAIHSFCLDSQGQLLATCGGERVVSRRSTEGIQIETVKEPSGVCVIRPDGDLLDRWPLKMAPQAINVAPNGLVFCGGEGKLVKLSTTGSVLLEADAPNVAELPPLEPEDAGSQQGEDSQRGLSDEERQTRIESLRKQLRHELDELRALHTRVRGRQLDDTEQAALEAEFEKSLLRYNAINQELKDLETTPEVAAARRRAMAIAKRRITGIAATARDVFVACPASQGYGYDVWRTDHDFKNGKKVVTSLRGCCGQMDIQAHGDTLYVAENSRMRVVRFDRDGNKLGAWGKGDRNSVEGFGSCCNPMNVRLGPDGEVYTSEASVGRVKRFSVEGEFLGLVGNVTIVPGCKHVPIGVSSDGDRVYMLDITRTHILVLQRRNAARDAAAVAAGG